MWYNTSVPNETNVLPETRDGTACGAIAYW